MVNKEMKNTILITIDILDGNVEEIENDIYKCWRSANEEGLKDDFILEHKTEYEEYCSTIFKTLHREQRPKHTRF